MRNKFFHAVLLCTLIVLSHVSNAGLVIGNQEFLELEYTNSKNLRAMNSVIANDPSLAGYQMATDVDMAMLFNMFPIGSYRSSESYYLVASNGNQINSALIDFFLGSAYVRGSRINTRQSAVDMHNRIYYYDQFYQGFISYIDTRTSRPTYASGEFRARVDSNGDDVAIFSYKDAYILNRYDLGNPATSSGNNTGYLKYSDRSSLWVRTVQVDAPSTLAILALGMIGLASRRFKKQS